MRLIGMLDSPYVRRVAISFEVMGLEFTHESLSVFRDISAFRAVNPVIKAPTLVTTDGVTIMDSTLILQHADCLVPATRRLSPSEPATNAVCLRLVGLALALADKSIQIVYEHQLRPAEKIHAPWLERVKAQMCAAILELDAAAASAGTGWLCATSGPSAADIAVAVAATFVDLMKKVVTPPPARALARFTSRAEALAPFRAWPSA